MSKSTIGRILLALCFLAATAWAIAHVLTRLVSLDQLTRLLREVPPLVTLGLLALSTALMGMRSLRFHLLLRQAGLCLSFWQSLKVYLAGQALTPLPAGEGSRSLLLGVEAGAEADETLSPLILLGVGEMVVAVAIALLGSAFLDILRPAALIALLGVFGLVWLLVNHQAVRKLFARLPANPPLQRAGQAIVGTQREVRRAMFQGGSWRPSGQLLTNLGLALLTDLIGGSIIYVIIRYYQLPLGPLFATYLFSAATVLGELVPFSPGGIGATEGGMTGVLLLSGISLPSALAVVVVYRAATLAYGVCLGAVFLLAFYARPLLAGKGGKGKG